MRRVLVALIRLYQILLRPLIPPSCRYTPGCSEYGIQAIERFGPVGGTLLTLARILRCAPWGGWGYDPVPERFGTFGAATPSSGRARRPF